MTRLARFKTTVPYRSFDRRHLLTDVWFAGEPAPAADWRGPDHALVTAEMDEGGRAHGGDHRAAEEALQRREAIIDVPGPLGLLGPLVPPRAC
jgi:hypothetical protein